MSERRQLDDDAIAAMLEARATRATFPRPDIRDIVAAAGPRARRPVIGWPVGPWVRVAGVAAAGLAVVVVALVGGSRVREPGSSPTAGVGASVESSPVAIAATPSPSVRPVLTPIRLLTAYEAGEVIRTQSATRAGTLIVVEGRLEAPRSCRLLLCRTILVGAGSSIRIRPVGDIGPGPWDGSRPIDGPLVLRLTSEGEDGFPAVEFIGQLTVPPTGGPAWFVQDILEDAVTREGAYAAVRGWLVRDPAHPCGSDPRNPVVSYGCPTDDWLSESEFQPLQPDGSSLGPPAAIPLSSGAYDEWAPNPAAGGPDGRGVVPREATYLMRLVSDGCGPNADCLAPPPRWRIVGRFDDLEAPLPPLSASTEPRIGPLRAEGRDVRLHDLLTRRRALGHRR